MIKNSFNNDFIFFLYLMGEMLPTKFQEKKFLNQLRRLVPVSLTETQSDKFFYALLIFLPLQKLSYYPQKIAHFWAVLINPIPVLE